MIHMGRLTEEELDREAWELTRKLVMTESTDPGVYEGKIGEFICRWFAERGIETVREEVLPGRFNVMARVGKPEGKALVYICHMDTVILGEGWTEGRGPLDGVVEITGDRLQDDREEKEVLPNGGTAPLTGGRERRTGRLYGRGACDMKSGLACAMVSFAWAADWFFREDDRAQESEGWKTDGRKTDCQRAEGRNADGRKPGRRVPEHQELPESLVFIGTVDEEDFMRGAEAAIRSGWVKREDWVVDMEPTDGQIQASHKGRVWFELNIKGEAAHASMPWKGADAIAGMAEAVCRIRKEIAACPAHPELGISTVTFGQITGGVRPYVVPESCTVWIDMRLVPPMDQEGAERVVRAGIQAAKENVPGTDGNYLITGSRPYVERDENSGLLAALLISCERITGRPAEIGPFPGYTDTAVIAGILKNHNCMSYGPGSLSMAHKPDEYVDREGVVRCRRVFCDLAGWIGRE
ncbi:MAG: M20 family metallopeptidase, partial [Lachnospiraceae bacterium]|nr:M20 family metallopeptidase [Lachnospiraceae bacterium]